MPLTPVFRFKPTIDAFACEDVCRAVSCYSASDFLDRCLQPAQHVGFESELKMWDNCTSKQHSVLER